MIKAAIVGMGTWGQNLVKSVQGVGMKPDAFAKYAAKEAAAAQDIAHKVTPGTIK